FTTTAEFVVTGHPASRQVGAGPLQQVQRDSPTLLEDDAGGDVGLGPTLRIVGPRLGQVQTGVQQRFAPSRRVADEDADLTVVDLAQAAAPLAAHPARLRTFLGEARAVQDPDAIVLGQLRADVTAQLGQDRVV